MKLSEAVKHRPLLLSEVVTFPSWESSRVPYDIPINRPLPIFVYREDIVRSDRSRFGRQATADLDSAFRIFSGLWRLEEYDMAAQFLVMLGLPEVARGPSGLIKWCGKYSGIDFSSQHYCVPSSYEDGRLRRTALGQSLRGLPLDLLSVVENFTDLGVFVDGVWVKTLSNVVGSICRRSVLGYTHSVGEQLPEQVPWITKALSVWNSDTNAIEVNYHFVPAFFERDFVFIPDNFVGTAAICSASMFLKFSGLSPKGGKRRAIEHAISMPDVFARYRRRDFARGGLSDAALAAKIVAGEHELIQSAIQLDINSVHHNMPTPAEELFGATVECPLCRRDLREPFASKHGRDACSPI